MAETQRESFFDRTLTNLSIAWREIAASAARTVGRSVPAKPPSDGQALRKLMADCLEARGGEVSARLRAAELGETYLELDTEGRHLFLEILAREFAADTEGIERRIAAYNAAEETEQRVEAAEALRVALRPPRLRLLTQFNILPEGVKFLVDLRADLLPLASQDPYLAGLERDLRNLLESWFDVGFLDLRRITWSSPASLLERLIAYEAVHEISSWQDLQNRLATDRRLYALFHPRMPDEPLAFVEVALVQGLADNIQVLLDEDAPRSDADRMDTAIFYSISNTQKGLRGISFGEYLIKRVVERLSHELPQLKAYATLSPIPGFRSWLEHCPPEVIRTLASEEEQESIKALSDADDVFAALQEVLGRPDWHEDPATVAALKKPMSRLCARYYLEVRDTGEPIDPVARFHLKNGARLERINWLADISAKGQRQSAGLMVNYSYVREDIEKNHETYMQRGKIAMGPEVKSIVKSMDAIDGSPLWKLGFGRAIARHSGEKAAEGQAEKA